jgi:parallel beta-helix repeat protein
MRRVHNKNIEDKKTEPSESSDKKVYKEKNTRTIYKAIIGLIIIIAIILAFSISLYFTNNDNNSNGQNHYKTSYYVSVNGKGDYSSIQKAVDSASKNDKIFVNSGTYFENIEINESIELVGEDMNNTIIEGNGSGIVVNILADNVKISGFTIKNGGPSSADSSNAGIVIRSNNNTISDCNISSNENYGLYIFSSPETRNNLVKNNTFSYNKYGIYTSYSKFSNISSNTFTHNTDYGIYLSSRSDDNIISNNIITYTQNMYGIRIKTSSRNKVINNNIMNNENGGLYFCCGASQNIVYKNNFINNTDWNANHGNLNNTWDNGEVGNYWDDYNGTDENGDGIGDTPYIIYKLVGEDYSDKLPLMKPI